MPDPQAAVTPGAALAGEVYPGSPALVAGSGWNVLGACRKFGMGTGWLAMCKAQLSLGVRSCKLWPGFLGDEMCLHWVEPVSHCRDHTSLPAGVRTEQRVSLWVSAWSRAQGPGTGLESQAEGRRQWTLVQGPSLCRTLVSGNF